MTKEDKVKNIFAFLSILFGESDFIEKIMEMHPDYIIEKFERYVLSDRLEYECGLHPSLRKMVFNKYLMKHGLSAIDEI